MSVFLISLYTLNGDSFFADLHCKLFSSCCFSNTQRALKLKSCLTLVKMESSFILAPESLIQKLQVGPRSLFAASILNELDRMVCGLTLRNSAILETIQGSAFLSLPSGTSFSLQITQSMQCLLS